MRIQSSSQDARDSPSSGDGQNNESNASLESSALLSSPDGRPISYGGIPGLPRRQGSLNFSFRSRQHSPTTPKLSLPQRRVYSLSRPASPTVSLFRSRISSQRPITAYDTLAADGGREDIDAKINGVRVWYSSFTSIDWLHDAIKGAARFSRLRRRKGVRARLRLVFDKSLGWIIVTIVGFLTALVAFFIIRSEQLLFDLKEGYCVDNWLLAKRFCCLPIDETVTPTPFLELDCPAWRDWPEAFNAEEGTSPYRMIEYMSYTSSAVSLPHTARCDSFIQHVISARFSMRLMLIDDLPHQLLHIFNTQGIWRFISQLRCAKYRQTRETAAQAKDHVLRRW
jgi:hypothetical protein